jgi:hypothetical protein
MGIKIKPRGFTMMHIHTNGINISLRLYTRNNKVSKRISLKMLTCKFLCASPLAYSCFCYMPLMQRIVLLENHTCVSGLGRGHIFREGIIDNLC